jgi:isopentenyldiphosphate isomerase
MRAPIQGECCWCIVRGTTIGPFRIIRKLAVGRYQYRTRHKGRLKPKAVHYFLMERLNRRIKVPGDEVDLAEWVELDEASRRLTYKQDKKLLDLL